MSNSYNFEHYTPSSRTKKSFVDGMKAGEVRVFTKSRQSVQLSLKRWLRLNPKHQFSWALNVPGKIAVRREEDKQ